MKVRAKLTRKLEAPEHIEFHVDEVLPPKAIHWGGAVFEVRSSSVMPLPDGSFLADVEADEVPVFSAELGREVTLLDEDTLEDLREKMLGAVAEGARANVAADQGLLAAILSRYITGSEDEAREWALLAESAFNAYNAAGATHWVTFDDRPVPRWKDLNDDVRAKWTAAAKGLVLEEVRRRRAAVQALEELQQKFDAMARVDGPVFNMERAEGRADVCAMVRNVLPKNASKLDLDALVEKVRSGYALLAMLRLAHDNSMDSTGISSPLLEQMNDWLHSERLDG